MDTIKHMMEESAIYVTEKIIIMDASRAFQIQIAQSVMKQTTH